MSSSTKTDNKKRYLNSWQRSYTRIRTYTVYRKMYSINFINNNKNFCLSWHYNGANSFLFVNGKEINNFVAKDSEIVATPLCLGNTSKDWSLDNMKKVGLNGYVYDFTVDYHAFPFKAIQSVHKYLMIKNEIV